MRIISGKFRGRKLYPPKDGLTRPTSDRTREALFNILEHSLGIKYDGLKVLDLYAGTGSLGIEALSRGASFCLFIDSHPSAREIIQKNITPFGESAAISAENVSDLPPNPSFPFDLVFLDPPYGKNLVPLALKRLSSGLYLKKGSFFMIETGHKEDIEKSELFCVLKEKIYGKTKLIFAQHLK